MPILEPIAAAVAEEGAGEAVRAREGFVTGNPVEYPPLTKERLLKKLWEMGVKLGLDSGIRNIAKQIKESK